MLWSASGPKTAMKSDVFGQAGGEGPGLGEAEGGREDQRDQHARSLWRGPGRRRGRDEPVDRISGGDGGEPGAHADV